MAVLKGGDAYLRGVLTVIAVSLAVIAGRDLFTGVANAQRRGDVQDVRIVESVGLGVQVSNKDPIPVRLRGPVEVGGAVPVSLQGPVSVAGTLPVRVTNDDLPVSISDRVLPVRVDNESLPVEVVNTYPLRVRQMEKTSFYDAGKNLFITDLEFTPLSETRAHVRFKAINDTGFDFGSLVMAVEFVDADQTIRGRGYLKLEDFPQGASRVSEAVMEIPNPARAVQVRVKFESGRK